MEGRAQGTHEQETFIRFALFSVALIALMLISAAPMARAGDTKLDECATAGKLASMLGQLDKCEKYELTEGGREAQISMVAKAAQLGDECLTKGGQAMLRTLAVRSPHLLELAASGDTKMRHVAMCDAIANYLRFVTKAGGGEVFLEKR